MHISFNPALGETVHIHTPSYKSTVRLHFTAAFLSPADYEVYNQEGVKVELWSEVTGTKGWAALPFVECGSPQTRGTCQALFLIGESSSDTPDETRILSLSFSVPFPRETSYAYTYRLVYPSGEIKWLGHPSNNGVLVFDMTLSYALGWTIQTDDCESHCWDARGTPVDGQEVAKLNTMAQCTLWALGKDGLVNDSPMNSSLVFVVPNNYMVSSPTLVLSAASGSSISFTSVGGLTFTGSGESFLLRQTYRPGSDLKTFMTRVSSHSTHCFKLLSCHINSNHVVLTSPEGVYPAFGLIVPLFSETAQRAIVSIPVHCLASLFPCVSRLAIFSPVHSCSRVVDVHSDIPEEVSFVVGNTGGRFVLSPVHRLGSQDMAWEVSVLSPYSQAALTRDPDTALPTPPSSPRFRPVAHLSHLSPTASSAIVPSLQNFRSAHVDESVTSSASAVIPTQPRLPLLVQFLKCSFALTTAVLTRLLRLLLGTLRPKRTDPADDPDLDQRTPLRSDQEVEDDNRIVVTSPTSSSHVNNPALIPEPPNDRLKTIIVDAHSTTVSLLLRSCHAKASVDEVEIDSGRSKAGRKVRKVEEGVFLVEFDLYENGRVKVSVR